MQSIITDKALFWTKLKSIQHVYLEEIVCLSCKLNSFFFVGYSFALDLIPSPYAKIRYGKELGLTCILDDDWQLAGWTRNEDGNVFSSSSPHSCNNSTVGNISTYCYDNILKMIDPDPVNNTEWICTSYSGVNEFSSGRTFVQITGSILNVICWIHNYKQEAFHDKWM